MILISKFLKFAEEYKRTRSNTIVIKDKAPIYTSKFQELVFLFFDIMRLL